MSRFDWLCFLFHSSFLNRQKSILLNFFQLVLCKQNLLLLNFLIFFSIISFVYSLYLIMLKSCHINTFFTVINTSLLVTLSLQFMIIRVFIFR
jgi:hypothetical protein